MFSLFKGIVRAPAILAFWTVCTLCWVAWSANLVRLGDAGLDAGTSGFKAAERHWDSTIPNTVSVDRELLPEIALLKKRLETRVDLVRDYRSAVKQSAPELALLIASPANALEKRNGQSFKRLAQWLRDDGGLYGLLDAIDELQAIADRMPLDTELAEDAPEVDALNRFKAVYQRWFDPADRSSAVELREVLDTLPERVRSATSRVTDRTRTSIDDLLSEARAARDPYGRNVDMERELQRRSQLTGGISPKFQRRTRRYSYPE